MSFGDPTQQSGTTPDRTTVLRLDDGPWIGQTRLPWSIERAGAEIGTKRKLGHVQSTGVHLQPGGAHMLAPFNGQPELIVTEDWHDAVIKPEDTNHPDGYIGINKFRKSADPTMGIGGSVLSTAVPGLQKRRAAGASSEATLGVQQAAEPAPPGGASDTGFASDRILESKEVFPENTGFTIVFGYPPNSVIGSRGWAMFFFGGATDVVPSSEKGGRFCLMLHGDGNAELFEQDNSADTWGRRTTFQWAAAVDNAQAHDVAISISPYGRNRIAIRVAVADSAFPSSHPFAHAIFGRFNRPQDILWEDVKVSSGHDHLHFATGPGRVQVEIRRDVARQTPVWIYRHKYAESGTLVDAPFAIDRDLPDGTPIKATTSTYLLPNTGVSLALYDASTHLLLPTDGDGNFLTVAGQKIYYAKIGLTSDNRYNSPALMSYRLQVAGATQTVTGSPILVKPRSLSHTGPDVTPDHESAELTASDLRGTQLVLRERDRIFSRLAIIQRSTGDLLTYLLEGETVRSPAKRRGVPGRSYPSPEWRDFTIRMLGLWGRLADQFNMQIQSFDQDPNAPIDPVTGRQIEKTWKVTDIIRWWFDQCGVPEDELDVPDYDLRLAELSASVSQLPKETYNAVFGTDSSRAITTLVRDFLGHYLIRDPNASKSGGARGLWRVLKPTTQSGTNYLFDVHLRRPDGSGGKSGTAFGTYGDRACWVYRDSFNTYTRAPEASHVYVFGCNKSEGQAGDTQIQQSKFNPRFNDPTYAGFFGRVVPLVRVDPNITEQTTANFLCARYYEIACLPQKWAEAHLPLLLVTDLLDPYQVRPRLPRVNDLFRVIDTSGTAHPAIVRSCNALIDKNDAVQGMDLEAMFLNSEALV